MTIYNLFYLAITIIDRNETDEEINSEELKTEFTSLSKKDKAKPAMIWHSHERDLLLSKRRFSSAEGE